MDTTYFEQKGKEAIAKKDNFLPPLFSEAVCFRSYARMCKMYIAPSVV